MCICAGCIQLRSLLLDDIDILMQLIVALVRDADHLFGRLKNENVNERFFSFSLNVLIVDESGGGLTNRNLIFKVQTNGYRGSL